MGEYIALLSNDTVVTEGWLHELHLAIKKDSRIMAVQSKLLLYHHPDKIDSLGHRVDPIGFLRAEGYMEDASVVGLKARRVSVMQLVSCLIPRSTISRVGLFDSDYFIIHEDTDISMRIALAGGIIVMVPSSLVYHIRSQTISKLPMHKVVYLNRRNILLTILKNYSSKSLIKLLPIHLFLSLALASWYLFGRRKILWCTSTIRGVWWNLINLQKTLAKRRFVQLHIRKVDDTTLFETMYRFNLMSVLKYRHTSPIIHDHIESNIIPETHP
jgi:GT2 family glycosyltransferase